MIGLKVFFLLWLPLSTVGMVLAESNSAGMWETAKQVPALVVLAVIVTRFLDRLAKNEERNSELLERITARYSESAKECHAVQRDSMRATERLAGAVNKLEARLNDGGTDAVTG